MDTDRLTTVTGMVQAICTVLIPLVPPPFNLIPVALAAAAFAVHGYATNKESVAPVSIAKVAGQAVVVLAMIGGLIYAGCSAQQVKTAEADYVKIEASVHADLLKVCAAAPAIQATTRTASQLLAPDPTVSGALSVAADAGVLLIQVCTKLKPLAERPGA